MKALFFALLLTVSLACGQEVVTTYADSISDKSISRAVADVTSFRQYWWGPFDVSECWSTRNLPARVSDTDTLTFQGYLSGIVRYAAGDTVLGRWKAYLANFPYVPYKDQTLTYDFDWNNADSLVSWKIRQASDFVSTKRDGYPMVSRYLINTAASDTVAYPYLFICLELDSTTGTPAAANKLDISAYWTYGCVKPK